MEKSLLFENNKLITHPVRKSYAQFGTSSKRSLKKMPTLKGNIDHVITSLDGGLGWMHSLYWSSIQLDEQLKHALAAAADHCFFGISRAQALREVTSLAFCYQECSVYVCVYYVLGQLGECNI